MHIALRLILHKENLVCLVLGEEKKYNKRRKFAAVENLPVWRGRKGMYLLLFGVWLVLNGRVTAEICALGAVISAAVFGFLCRFMDYSLKKEFLVFRLIPLFIQYFWVMVKEIVKANVCVLKIILSPEDWPEPALVYFDTELKTGLAKVMLADSITLTPGTITVLLEGNRYCVHCLDRELAEGMESSVFVELLGKMEEVIEAGMESGGRVNDGN